MSIKTSNTDFKTRIRQQIEDPIMRKAVANAQQRIGANRQKMVDELGHWEEWRDRAAQIRDHVLSNLDAYLYQLSEKVTQNGGHVYFARTKEDSSGALNVSLPNCQLVLLPIARLNNAAVLSGCEVRRDTAGFPTKI